MIFKRNKNKEKKPKWWSTSTTNNFRIDAGNNYKIISGLMILLCSGLILIAIAVVINGTPSMISQHNSLVPLWIAGGAICGTAFVGVIISIFLQMFVNKRREESDAEARQLKAKLNEQNKKYHDSRKKMISSVEQKKD